ncbi:MAG: tRNA (N6-isopentenyl adenosine(37)-C2)-methylthiotransferase MiaB [Candidatus Sumerlaeaceae bacterium]|nr:tRNA (N6-isopentenyl adenosine(37)-C2)-methylthiotransferase MiaB [Candidatus Sumerlaeaceae bacterium]
MVTAVPRKPKTFHIVTYGCQMNDNDSEIMAGILQARGMTPVRDETDADLVIVNTCVVREGAEERAVGRLASMAAAKRQRPEMIIAVAGCMAQKDGERILERLPMADLVVGTRDLFKIGALVDTVATTGERIVSIQDVDKPVFLDAHPVQRKSGLKALVTVMYGCNNFCSFCIVPKTRGREVSRPLREVVGEVRQLADQGYREVMLLGQNVNSYRHGGADFADLLAAVNEVPGIERIRFITSHPKDCSDRLISAMRSLEKVCENIHLPVQAGSNRVLRRMKRFYTREHYLDLLARLREQVPGVTVTTDIIVGFPDETDADFEETYSLVETARWDSAFMFMYSPRAGTKAAEWIDSIPLELKKHRLQRCIGRQEQISGEINAGYVGQTMEVLVESTSRRSDQELMGRTRGDKCVIFPGPASLVGSLVQVRVTASHPHTLFGQLAVPVAVAAA